VADIAAFLQITIDSTNTAALAAIAEVSEEIRNYCGQQIDLVEDDEVTLDCYGGTKIFLTELPVVSVASVVEDDETLVEGTDYKLGQYGILHRLNGSWRSGIQIITITYTHGRSTIPEDLKGVAARAAARRYQAGLRAAGVEGVPGVQAQSIGDYSVQFSAEQSGGGGDGGVLGASAAPILLPSEKRALNRYRA
jgi:hypothetical protein